MEKAWTLCLLLRRISMFQDIHPPSKQQSLKVRITTLDVAFLVFGFFVFLKIFLTCLNISYSPAIRIHSPWGRKKLIWLSEFKNSSPHGHSLPSNWKGHSVSDSKCFEGVPLAASLEEEIPTCKRGDARRRLLDYHLCLLRTYKGQQFVGWSVLRPEGPG